MRRKNLYKIALVVLAIFLASCVFDFGRTFLALVFFGGITYAYCDVALQTGRLLNSDAALEVYYSLKHALLSADVGRADDKDTGTTRADVSRDVTAGGSDESDDSVSEEVTKLKTLFIRDFVESWYANISYYQDGQLELHSLLDSMVTSTTSHIEKVEKYQLIIKFIKLYHNHLALFQQAKTLCQNQTTHSENIDQVLEIYSQLSTFHVATTDETTEHRYLRAVSRFLLLQLSHDDADKCYPAIEALSEIIAHNVLLPVINMMCETEWLHRVIINVVSDEEIEMYTAGGQVITSTPGQVCSAVRDGGGAESGVDRHGVADGDTAGSVDEMPRKKSVTFHSMRGDSDQETSLLNSDADKSYLIKQGTRVDSLGHHSYTTPNLQHYFVTTSPNHPPSYHSVGDIPASSFQREKPLNISSDSPTSDHIRNVMNREVISTDLNVSVDNQPHPHLQHDVRSAYFSKLGLMSSSPPHSPSSRTPDTWSLSSSVSSNTSLSRLPPESATIPTLISESPSVLPAAMIKPSRPIRIGSTSSNDDDEYLDDIDDIQTSTRPHVLGSSHVGSPVGEFSLKRPHPTQAPSVDLESRPSVAHSPYDEVDIATEYMKITVPLKSVGPTPVGPEGESITDPSAPLHQVPRRHSVPDLSHNIPSQLFKSLVISDCKEVRESNSSSTYVLYLIEYEAWYTDDNGELVVGPGFAHRRYREFINLQSRLEENPIYKKGLKGIKGPTKWFTLPLLDKSLVIKRKQDLQVYLEKLINRDDINCSPDLREFLAYGGDAHIAFVKKAPELNVPRIDKFVVRQMSVVKDRLVTALPTIPSDGAQTMKKTKTKTKTVRESNPETEDKDLVDVECSFDTQKSDKTPKDEKSDEAAMCESSGSMKDIGPRLAADGSDNPDATSVESTPMRQDTLKKTDTRKFLTHECDGTLPLVSVILDLAAQSANGNSPLITDQVLKVFWIVGGKALECWLHKEIDELTSCDRVGHYLSLLREVIWPAGVLMSGEEEVKSPEQLQLTRQQAARCLKEFLPDVLPFVLDHDFDEAVEQLMSSIECPRLNRHFIYCLLDMLLEEVFPEITIPNFGQLALLKEHH